MEDEGKIYTLAVTFMILAKAITQTGALLLSGDLSSGRAKNNASILMAASLRALVVYTKAFEWTKEEGEEVLEHSEALVRGNMETADEMFAWSGENNDKTLSDFDNERAVAHEPAEPSEEDVEGTITSIEQYLADKAKKEDNRDGV